MTMKLRRSILWFCAAAAVLIALLIWFGKRPPAVVSTELVQANTNPSPPAERAPIEPRSDTGVAPAETNDLNRSTPRTKTPQPPYDSARQGLSALNDVPIIYYGKLEDQFGDPVVGATIVGNTIVYNGTRSGAEHVSTRSDANGFFQITAGKGESLGIMPRKAGFALATTRTEFKYSYMYDEHFTPDPNNPVVTKMWKLQGAEALLGIDQQYKIHFTNAPVYVDLLRGTIVPTGGDLKITVSRSPGVVSARNRED